VSNRAITILRTRLGIGAIAERGRALSGLALAGICAISVALFLPPYRDSFVLDDYKHLEFIAPFLNSPFQAYKAISPYWIGWYYRPVQHWLFLAARLVFGLQPPGYYCMVLALHLTAILLVYAVARRLGVGRPGALAAALLFAVNARNADVLGWASSVSVAASAVAALLAVCFYLGYRQDPGKPALMVGVVLCSILALLSREEGFVLPAFLALVWTTGPAPRRLGRAEVLAGLTLAALLVIYVVFQLRRPTWTAGTQGLSLAHLLQSVAQQGVGRSLIVIVSRYTLLDLAPVLKYADLVTFFTILVLAILVMAMLKGSRATRLGLAWAVLFLAFGYMAFWSMNPEAIADRYLYLPLAGISLALGAGLERLQTAPAKGVRSRYVVAVLFALPMVVAQAAEIRQIYGATLQETRTTQSIEAQMRALLPDPSPATHIFAYHVPPVPDYVQAMAAAWYGRAFASPGGDVSRLRQMGKGTPDSHLFDYSDGVLYDLMPELREHPTTVFVYRQPPLAEVWRADRTAALLDAGSFAVDQVAGPVGQRRLSIRLNAVPPEQGWAGLTFSVTVPPGSRLAFGVGKDAGGLQNEDGMVFRVRIEDSVGSSDVLYETRVETSGPGMDAGWQMAMVPVERYWEQPVKLRLEVFARANNLHDYGYWANPRFVIDN
jgi:hypothetical protein